MLANRDREVVLSYYDCLLRRADIDLLRGPYWLNDAIIGFYFEFLERKFNSTNPQKLLFISPELTQLLKLSDPGSYAALLDPLHAKKSSFIFFPLNNCNLRDAAGGSHWSLLIYGRDERTCYHFDSSKGFNEDIAKNFSNNLMQYLNDGALGNFISDDCPQQDNSYDCGLFVICFTDIVAEHVIKTSRIMGCNLSEIKPIVRGARRNLLELIEKLIVMSAGLIT